MADWANFFLYMISSAVSTIFGLELGVGFSLGDAEVALFVIGLIASGFIMKFGSTVAGAATIGLKERFKKHED